jgi:DNA-directed RNA polymerase beta' subunit
MSRNTYKFKLLSDEEILSKSEGMYSEQNLLSKNYTIDSNKFGASLVHSRCGICFQPIESCIGHYHCIQLPCPIVKTLCQRDFIQIIQLLCPICSHFLIPNIKNVLNEPKQKRMGYIKKQFDAYVHGQDVIVCPTCKNEVTPTKVFTDSPKWRIGTQLQGKQIDQYNPIHIYNILQNFTELEESGYSKSYQPQHFMTILLPIVTNKLRPKNITSTESTLTTYYKFIIEGIIPSLSQLLKGMSFDMKPIIPNGDISQIFNDLYDKLYSYYILITDMGSDVTMEMALQTIEKKDRKHIDPHNPLMGRLKGKQSLFHLGIISTRHNVSARTVLGGAIDSSVLTMNIPYHISNKLGIFHPIYEENIKAIRQLILLSTDRKYIENINNPRCLRVINKFNGKNMKITPKNALSIASNLQPGDKVMISLLSYDFCQQSRFPSMREESWTSLEVVKDNNSLISIPLQDCEMKAADFDGDEAQAYCIYSHTLDVECLLLHSIHTQMIAYKLGNMAIEFIQDIPTGFLKLNENATSMIRLNRKVPSYRCIDEINKLLPLNFNYKDAKILIKDSKIIGSARGIGSQELYKYINTLYGSAAAIKLVDGVTQIAYDVLRHEGSTIGYEITAGTYDDRMKIKEIINETYNEMIELEKSNDPNKDLKQINTVEKLKLKIKPIMISNAKGSNLDNLGFLISRQEEYYQIACIINHTIIAGSRIKPILAEGSRVDCSFPRYSVDPRAYGFNDRCYKDDIGANSHFNESEEQRRSMYDKGEGTAKQGYLSKRLGAAHGFVIVNACNLMVSTTQIVAFKYGVGGFNPRLFVSIEMPDITLSRDEFEKKYKCPRLRYLHQNINDSASRYKHLTYFTKLSPNYTNFSTGFNWEQFINSHDIPMKGTTPKEKVDKFINDMYDIYATPTLRNLLNINEQSDENNILLENFTHHEYYFRVKCYNFDCSSLLNEMKDIFTWTLAQAGDPVGMKSCIAASEPLTQAVLHAIHYLGGGARNEKIRRSAGVDRFEELLGGNTVKNSILTLKLYDDSEISCIEFANEQETFYLSGIWSRMELCISNKIPKSIIDQHKKDIDLNNIIVNIHFIKCVWNIVEVSSFNIHVVDIINALTKNYTDIMFISGHVLNNKEFVAYIFFKQDVPKYAIENIMEEWRYETSRTIIHGKYLKNCHVFESETNKGHYLIEANEVSSKAMVYENIIFDPKIDPFGCKITNIETIKKMYGIFEASAHQHEALIYTATNLSNTNGLLNRNYKTLTDCGFVSGDISYGSRNSLRVNENMDMFRMINFETPKDMLIHALKEGNEQEIADPVAAAIFGDLPDTGSGVHRVSLFAK